MENSQMPEQSPTQVTSATTQAPTPAPAPAPQPIQPPRRLVVPWKLLMKISLVAAVIPFLIGSYFFFMSSQTATASQKYYAQAQQYADAGKIAEATNTVTLAEQNALASSSAKTNAYIAVLIFFVFIGDSLFLRHLAQKQEKASQEQL